MAACEKDENRKYSVSKLEFENQVFKGCCKSYFRSLLRAKDCNSVNSMKHQIYSLIELAVALKSQVPAELEIHASLLIPYALILPPGFSMKGVDPQKNILSFNNGDGIGLTADNEISDLTIQTSPSHRAIYTLSNHVDLGIFRLKNLTVTGQIQILTRIGTNKAKLIAEKIDIVSCDARRCSEQPQKYGVNVYQGAFTVYNFNGDAKSVIEATITDLSVGRPRAPVLGSGLFISGYGDQGGMVQVDTLTTNEIHSNGMIPYGTADMITAAVFIVYGAYVKSIVHHGAITTYGVNDMVLDAWGKVERWVAEQPVTSYGPSGIGFVNFGIVDYFEAKEKIETFGLGARGFNQYDGTIEKAIFNSIITHGDGSIGIQVSKPVGNIEVKGAVVTHGSTGATLVKGVIMNLPANGISVKAGGEIGHLILSDVETQGDKVISLEVDGKISNLSIKNGILARGLDSVGVAVSDGGQIPLQKISVNSAKGIAVRLGKSVKPLGSSELKAHGAKGDIINEQRGSM